MRIPVKVARHLGFSAFSGLTSRPGCGILPAMFWYVILMLFSPLYLLFGLVFRSEQARLVLALYQQVLVLSAGVDRP